MSENNTSKQHLLVVGTVSENKRFVFQQLRQYPNLHLVVVNHEKNWAFQYADQWLIADLENKTQVITVLRKYHRQHPIDGVVSFSQNHSILVSRIVDEFALPGISFNSASTLLDKLRFRSLSKDLHSLKCPVLDIQCEKLEKQTKVNFPAVVKPVRATHDSFVSLVNSEDELEDVQKIFSSDSQSNSHQLMIEQYIDGDEVDIDVCLQNGKIKLWSVSDHLSTEEPFFSEIGTDCPSTLTDKQLLEIRQVVELLLERSAVLNGMLHVEAIATNKGVLPISVKTIASVDDSYFSAKYTWGVDLIKLSVDLALGEYIQPVKTDVDPQKFSSSRKVTSPRSGIISSLSYPNSWPRQLEVRRLEANRTIGDTVLIPPNGFQPVVSLVCTGDSSNEADENAEETSKLIELEVIPFSSVSAVGKTKRTSRFSSARLSAEAIRSQARMAKFKTFTKSQQRKMIIGVACNTYQKTESSDEDTVENELTHVGENIQRVLEEIGYRTVFIDFNQLSKAVDVLENEKIDLVFNVCERINDSSLLEPHAASIFDAFQIPYTGSNPTTLGLSIDKIRVKKMLSYHQVPTAKWDYLYEENDDLRSDLQYPLIVKPAATDNSIGITQDSVVTNKAQLKEQIHYVMSVLKSPALIEEYLPGDEFDVSIIGSVDSDLEALPLSRVVYDKFPSGLWHIRSFDYKFKDSGRENDSIEIQRPPKNISKKLISLVTEIALDTFMIMQANDYARVDIKLDSKGNPHVLELNPNPSINIGDCVPSVAKVKGIEYPELLEKIISSALHRYQNFPPYHHLQPLLR